MLLLEDKFSKNSPVEELCVIYQLFYYLKLNSLTDLDIQDIPSKYTKKYKAPSFNLNADNNVDAIDLIFPNESKIFKEDLRKIANVGINKYECDNGKFILSTDEINNNNI